MDDRERERRAVAAASRARGGRGLVDLTDDGGIAIGPPSSASPPTGAHNGPSTADDEAFARRIATEEEVLAADEALAKRLAEECERCQAAPANPGFSWCTACYEAMRRPDPATAPVLVGRSVCARCGARPPNPGFDLCGSCFQISRRSGTTPCTLCHVAAANPGFDWCTGCYLAQRNLGGFGGNGGGAFSGGGLGGAPPENATYEELLAWEEARGAAGPSKGMSGQQLSALPQRSFLGPRDALKGGEAVCAICMSDYEVGESLSILSCLHTFHVECVSTWLKDKPSCPVCMRDVKGDMR